MEEKETRSLILELEATKTELVNVVNKAISRKIPCYFIDMILTDICTQVKNGAANELARERQQND